ncbi:AlpA family phage regulatory protein [Methylococcus sp. ANG]
MESQSHGPNVLHTVLGQSFRLPGAEAYEALPRRFNLTPRCVVWYLAEVEAWIEERKRAPCASAAKPDVHLRKTRPVRAGSAQG